MLTRGHEFSCELLQQMHLMCLVHHEGDFVTIDEHLKIIR